MYIKGIIVISSYIYKYVNYYFNENDLKFTIIYVKFIFLSIILFKLTHLLVLCLILIIISFRV